MKSISPSDLLADSQNPRLLEPSDNPREALRAIAKKHGKELINLAEDIVEHGMSPLDVLIVMPVDKGDRRYITLEGNRRITSLRMLENPDAFVGAIDQSSLDEIRRLSKKYQERPIESVNCWVVNSRAEADRWVHLRHTGRNGGVGLLPWGADETARFKSREGKKDLRTQALNFLEQQGVLTPEKRGQIPTDTLRRLLSTPEVREQCGLRLSDGKLLITAEPDAVCRSLMFIIDKLISKETQTKHVMDATQRREFAENMPAAYVAKPTLPEPVSIGDPAATASSTKKSAAKYAKVRKPRNHLIPRDCKLAVTQPRIAAILVELQKLDLVNCPNAVSVLFRVFLELSVDEYISSHSLQSNLDNRGGDFAKLRSKVEVVISDLISGGRLNRQSAAPARKLLQKDSFACPSIDLLNEYVHSFHMHPTPTDLRAHWDSIQPFFVAIWSP